MTRKRWVVMARECGGQRRYRECGVLATDEFDARRRAVRRWYGSNATWCGEVGLGPNYGQVVGPGGRCLTDRLRIDAGTYATTVRHASDGPGWQRL